MSLRDVIRERTKRKKMGKSGPEVTRARARKGAVLTAIKDLESQLRPHEQRAINTWVKMLDATTPTYEKVSGTWSDAPDWRARDLGATKIMAYLHGLPVQRQVQLQGTFEDLAALMDRARQSPEALRHLVSLQNVSLGNESAGETANPSEESQK